jgi:hypothetical protein
MSVTVLFFFINHRCCSRGKLECLSMESFTGNHKNSALGWLLPGTSILANFAAVVATKKKLYDVDK